MTRCCPEIAAGRTQLAFAALEAPGRYELSYVASQAVHEEGGWRLCARKNVVLDAPSADYFLVSARTGGEPGDAEGITLFLVPRTAAWRLTCFPMRRNRAHEPPIWSLSTFASTILP